MIHTLAVLLMSVMFLFTCLVFLGALITGLGKKGGCTSIGCVGVIVILFLYIISELV